MEEEECRVVAEAEAAACCELMEVPLCWELLWEKADGKSRAAAILGLVALVILIRKRY